MNIQTIQRSRAEAALIRQFDAESATPGKRAAFERFAALGLPTRRIESWHYTDLRSAMTVAAPPADAPDAAALEQARALLASRRRLGAGRLVLINGRYAKDLSDTRPLSVTVESEPSWPALADDAMTALNEAMTSEACRVDIVDAQTLEEPVEVVHVALGDGPQAIYSRIVIVAGAGARASLVESFVGASSATQRNAVTSFVLGMGARIKRIVTVEDEPGLHVESLVGRLGANAEFDDFALVPGGALTRRQLFLDVAGEGAKLALGGLTLVDGSRRADTTLQVTHSAPGGTSREFYRAIVDDDGVGTFQGKITVAKAAQKTDGAMKSQAVLLSPTAQMNAKPELEIFADDVVCGHGATVASLDPEQLFYLEARGISGPEAEAMLLEAFGEEAIARVENEASAEALRAQFRGWLYSSKRGRTRPAEPRR
jgi:Fe-S cluster assembly protein SufD